MIKSLKPQRIIYVLFGTGNHCTNGRFGFSCSFQPEFSNLVESQLSLHQQHHRFPTFTRQNHMVRPLHDQPRQRNRVLHRHPWAVTGATHAFYHCSMGIMCWVVRFGHAVVHHTSLGILEVHMDKWQQSTKMSFSNQGSTSQSKLFIFQSSSCSCLRDGMNLCAAACHSTSSQRRALHDHRVQLGVPVSIQGTTCFSVKRRWAFARSSHRVIPFALLLPVRFFGGDTFPILQ